MIKAKFFIKSLLTLRRTPMIGFGHWLLMLIFVGIAVWVVEIQFEKSKQKFLYFTVIVMLFIAFICYAYYDWRKYTIYQYDMTEQFLNLHYLSGKKELVAYHDIENVKFFAQKGFRCGLSFYIKNKPNIRTISNIPCEQVKNLRTQLFNQMQ